MWRLVRCLSVRYVYVYVYVYVPCSQTGKAINNPIYDEGGPCRLEGLSYHVERYKVQGTRKLWIGLCCCVVSCSRVSSVVAICSSGSGIDSGSCAVIQ